MIEILAALAVQAVYTDHGNPTAAEQRVLEIINRARLDPTAEGTRLGILITEGLSGPEMADVGPRPPLAMSGRLLTASRAHSLDMYTRAFFAHVNPSGDDPDVRITAAGYIWFGYAENIAMSTVGSAENLEDLLMIDAGVAGRGHRKALLDINALSSTYLREIGIGYYSGPVAKPISMVVGNFRDFITQDFGRDGTEPFLLGVVYIDANSNNFYDEGEGIGGVSVTQAVGTFSALTASAGGYAFPTAASGGITLTFAGSSLPVLSNNVAVTLVAANQKVDFRISAAAGADGDGNGLPDFWEARFPTATVAGADTDADGFTNLQEFRGGSDPTSLASTPGSVPPPPPPPPAPPSSSSSGGGGGCGLTGLDALLVAWAVARLSSRRRRRV